MKKKWYWIIGIIIIVFVAIVIYFILWWGCVSTPGCGQKPFVSPEYIKNQYCIKFVTENKCNVSLSSILMEDYDANKNGKWNDNGGASWNPNTDCGSSATSGDNLATFCLCYYGIETDDKCKALCGC